MARKPEARYISGSKHTSGTLHWSVFRTRASRLAALPPCYLATLLPCPTLPSPQPDCPTVLLASFFPSSLDFTVCEQNISPASTLQQGKSYLTLFTCHPHILPYEFMAYGLLYRLAKRRESQKRFCKNVKMAAKGRAKGGGPNRDTPGVNIEMSGSSFLVLVLVWGLIAIWPIKAAQATAEEDQNARVIVNRGAVMVVVAEPQTRINVVSEFFNIKPLKEIQNKIKEILDYAEELKAPKKVPLNEARSQCPLIGGREEQPDPTMGPHPAYLPNPSKWDSPLELFTRSSQNKSSCSYTVYHPILESMGRSIASYHYAQAAEAHIELSKLLSPRCANGSTGQGMIEGEFRRVIFPHDRSYNLIICAELCRNMHEMAGVNCSDVGDIWGQIGCGIEGCRTYSYNPLSRACHLSPHSNPDIDTEWYTPLGKPGGKTAIFSSVHCQSAVLSPKVTVRAPRSHNTNKFPLWSARAACLFDPLVFQSRFPVYTRCTTAGNLLKTLISNSADKIEKLEKRIKIKNKGNSFRIRRSPAFDRRGVSSPHVISFISKAMLTLAPTFQSVPAIGPSLSIVLSLAGSLLPLITNIASASASHDNYPVSHGVLTLSKHRPTSLKLNWSQSTDIASIDYRAPTTSGVSLATWIQSIVEQSKVVDESISGLLDNPHPRHKKIHKYLSKQRSAAGEVNFVTFYTAPHFLRRQFYWPSPIKAGNPINTHILLSLHPDLPLAEGWRSVISLGKAPAQGVLSHHCISLFDEKGPIPDQCFDKNRLGTPAESVFPASSKYLIIKVLGRGKIIQILCGGDFLPATFSAKGVFLALVGRNCNVFTEGGLLVQAENSVTRLGYKVLLDQPPISSNHSVRLFNDRFANSANNVIEISLSIWMSVLTIALLIIACYLNKTSPCKANSLVAGSMRSNEPACGRPLDSGGPSRPPPPLPPLRNYPDYTTLPYPTYRKPKEAEVST